MEKTRQRWDKGLYPQVVSTVVSTGHIHGNIPTEFGVLSVEKVTITFLHDRI
jgi:hypothetical protein